MNNFLARLGDRINPIVVKETRQAVNSRLVAAFLLLFLTVQFVVMLLMITTREFADTNDLNLRPGRDMFTFVQGILLGTCMVLIPALTGVRLAVERSDVNVDLLFISSLTPRAVIAGKLFAAGALALLIFSACAPFMAFAYVMRGLDVPTILLVLTADYLAVLLTTALALFLASLPANRGLRIFLGVGGFFAMCYIGAGLLALSSGFLRFGFGFDTASWEFWLGCAGIVALVFGVIGIFFVWSVALISPPAANRALGVRVYTLGFWIATALGFGIWSLHVGRPEPMLFWGFIGCALFSLQMIIASCERDAWGIRVARRIPRRVILRVPAFLFYSGSAGGLLFGVIGAALSVIGLAVWYQIVPSGSPPDVQERPVTIAGLIAGYTYCYCLTAIGFRRLLTRSGFRCGYTWVLITLLFGLGCTVPYIVRFALFDRPRYGSDDLIILYLTNPVVMIGDATRGWDTHLGFTIFFLAAWGGILTAVNAPWFMKQVLDFRPSDPEGETPRGIKTPARVEERADE
jgi:hypothetical protein